ncbi:MAG: hypothetical protein ACO1O6_03800 [Bacteroidota bacterium]
MKPIFNLFALSQILPDKMKQAYFSSTGYWSAKNNRFALAMRTGLAPRFRLPDYFSKKILPNQKNA